MTKKFFVFAILLLATFVKTSAVEQKDSTAIILMQQSTKPKGDHGGHPRSPAAPVYVALSFNTLTFGMSYVGCEVILFDGDETEVFADYVDTDGTVFIPDNFTGTFELRLIVGDRVYSAEIEL